MSYTSRHDRDETHIDSIYGSLDNIVGVTDIILYITTN